MLFQPLVAHGQPSACWVWAHALLITAVPIGGSRAAVPKCCKQSALEQQKLALRVPEARAVGWPCSVCPAGEPFRPVPHPLEVTCSPRCSQACGHHPSLCVSTGCVPSVCTCESAWGCVYTMRVKIFCTEWICPSGAGWGFWSPQSGVHTGRRGWASLQPWVRFHQSSFQPSLGTCSGPEVSCQDSALGGAYHPWAECAEHQGLQGLIPSMSGPLQRLCSLHSPGNTLKGARALGQSWWRPVVVTPGPVAVCVCVSLIGRGLAGAGDGVGGAPSLL